MLLALGAPRRRLLLPAAALLAAAVSNIPARRRHHLQPQPPPEAGSRHTSGSGVIVFNSDGEGKQPPALHTRLVGLFVEVKKADEPGEVELAGACLASAFLAGAAGGRLLGGRLLLAAT